MDVRMALAGVLIVGYVAYKGFERSGGKLPLALGARRSRSRPARRPPAPDRLAFERVTLDATSANLQAFIRLTGSLERLGFRIVSDYAVSGWPDTYCRGLVHPDKPVHAIVVERLGSPAHVELFTLFEDLSALVTSGSEEAEDPSKPAALRFQQLPGLTVDELYVQHVSSIDNLYQDQLSPMPATRLAFFDHQRALLVIEHELRKAKRALRTESLSRSLDVLPELALPQLLKRYGLEEPAEQPEPELQVLSDRSLPPQDVASAEPEEAPKRWGIGSSLLSKRMAAREEAEAPPEPERTLGPEPASAEVAVALELTVDEARETEPSDLAAASGAEPPFELQADPEPEALPVLSVEEAPGIDEPEVVPPLPFLVVPETPSEPADEAPLPFQVGVEAPSPKPTCPHCGATLFSSLSSRCSKCKQAVR